LVGSDQAYRAVERAIGLRRSNAELRRQLADIVLTYCPPSNAILDLSPIQLAKLIATASPIRPAARRRALKKIGDKARELRALLAGLEDTDDDTEVQMRVIDELLTPQQQGSLGSALTRLIGAAEREHKSAQDRGGPSANLRVREIIRELARVYQDTTGKPPRRSVDRMRGEPAGPFFAFVQVFFAELVPAHPADGFVPPNTPTAIDQAIRRALRRG
jgi:hypothetical protein